MSAVAATDMVRKVVAERRRQGAKIDHAFEDAGLIFKVPPRWVRSVIRGEPVAIKPRRAATIYAGFTAWLRADTERLEKQIAERRALLRAMEDVDVSEVALGESAECLAWPASLRKETG